MALRSSTCAIVVAATATVMMAGAVQAADDDRDGQDEQDRRGDMAHRSTCDEQHEQEDREHDREKRCHPDDGMRNSVGFAVEILAQA